MSRRTRNADTVMPSTEPAPVRASSRTAARALTQPHTARVTRAQSRGNSTEVDNNETVHVTPRRSATLQARPLLNAIVEHEPRRDGLYDDSDGGDDYEDAADRLSEDELPSDQDNDDVDDVDLPDDPMDRIPRESVRTSTAPEDYMLDTEDFDLDIPRFIGEVSDLYSNAGLMSKLFLQRDEDERLRHLEKVAIEGTQEHRKLRIYLLAFEEFTQPYKMSTGYIEPQVILRSLYGRESPLLDEGGPHRPDTIFHTVNLVQMLLDLVLPQPRPKWERLAIIEALFPRVVASDGYDREAIDLSLELTTQSMLAQMEDGAYELQHDQNAVSGYFMTVVDGEQQYKHWDALEVTNQSRDTKQRRAREVEQRIAELWLPQQGQRFNRKQIIARWRASFPWDQFKERLLSYCYDRSNELDLLVQHDGGILNMQNAIREAVQQARATSQDNVRSNDARSSLSPQIKSSAGLETDRVLSQQESQQDPVQPRMSRHSLPSQTGRPARQLPDQRRSLQPPPPADDTHVRSQSAVTHFQNGSQLVDRARTTSSVEIRPEASAGYNRLGANAARSLMNGRVPAIRKRLSRPDTTPNLVLPVDEDVIREAGSASTPNKRQRRDSHESIEPTQDGGFDSLPIDDMAAAGRRDILVQGRNGQGSSAQPQDSPTTNQEYGDSGGDENNDDDANDRMPDHSTRSSSTDEASHVRMQIEHGHERIGRHRTTRPQRIDHNDNYHDIEHDVEDDRELTPPASTAARIAETRVYNQLNGNNVELRPRNMWTAIEEAALNALVEACTAQPSMTAIKKLDDTESPRVPGSGQRLLQNRTVENIKDKCRVMLKQKTIAAGTNTGLPGGWKYIIVPANIVKQIESRGAEYIRPTEFPVV